jgi:hypothetical protein
LLLFVLVESQIGWFVSDLDNDEEGRKREEDEQEEMKVLKHGKECSCGCFALKLSPHRLN